MFRVFMLISYIIHLLLSFFGTMNFKMIESTRKTIVNSMLLLFGKQTYWLIDLLWFFSFKIELYCVASAGDSLKGERYTLNILKISSHSNW